MNSAGTVTVNDKGLVFSGDNLLRGDVSLNNGALVSVRAKETLDNVNTLFSDRLSLGSNINISANNLTVVTPGVKDTAGLAAIDAGLERDSGIKTAPTGDININATGQVSLNNSDIKNTIRTGSGGKIGNINIEADSVNIANQSLISSASLGNGDAGNININTAGDLSIIGTNVSSLLDGQNTNSLSYIYATNSGQGNSGRVTIDTKGNLSISNRGGIYSYIDNAGKGNSEGIKINAKNLSLFNVSNIQADNYSNGVGDAGNVDITTTGDISIIGTRNISLIKRRNSPLWSQISSNNYGKGDAGKVTINAKGDLLIANQGSVESIVRETGSGNSKGIKIEARNLTLKNVSFIETDNYRQGNAGDIYIKTTGNFTITNDIPIPGTEIGSTNSNVMNSTYGKGDTGKITVVVDGNLSISNRSGIQSEVREGAVGNGKGIDITAGNISLSSRSQITTDVFKAYNDKKAGEGNAGNIDIRTTKGSISVASASRISSSNQNIGESATIAINTDRLTLNGGTIFAKAKETSGGDINLTINDRLLMRNTAKISTDSGSENVKSQGGNIKINSPVIIALPGNNDITANAYMGEGGKVTIKSSGLFGIQPRSKGQDSLFTNDITASSTFGREGTMIIDTPGKDPGRDITELPTTTTDASKLLSHYCSYENRHNRLIVTGRGGIPENAYEPLNNYAIWQDPRAVKPQTAVSQTKAPVEKLPPPAVGWVFDGKGKVKLISAASPELPGTKIVCPRK